MAICIYKTISQLEDRFILTPERYNPKRRMTADTKGIKLSEIAFISEEVCTVNKCGERAVYQINTGDAMGGYLRIPSQQEKINSNKRVLHQGDVIISRLRPYLKQIAFVDEIDAENELFASTEFYVLRSRNSESIAFIVPYLLSDIAQSVFANSVEGSQHPRFKEDVLCNLIIPLAILEKRQVISEEVETAIRDYRAYERRLSNQITELNTAMKLA